MKNCDGCGQQTMSEFAWLIETANGTYWDGKYTDSRSFSPKIDDAIRFTREQDAQSVIGWIFQSYSFAIRATQHGWINGEPR